MKRLLVIGTLLWVWGPLLKAQDSLIDKDRKYIPRNLPDLVVGEKEAGGRMPDDSRRHYNFPSLKFSISTDPFFSLYLFGPYLRFDYTLNSRFTLFAGFGFSSSKQAIMPDAPVYFLPVNMIVALQEDYLYQAFIREWVKNKSSFAFEGGVSFGSLSKVVSERTFSLFLRYGKGSAYEKKSVPIVDSLTRIVTGHKVVITEYDANLFELCGVFRSPWGRITIVKEKSLFYMTLDWGLGVGVLNVKGRRDNAIVYKRTSFAVDVIFRFYAGVAF
ncbi:MAG: hypothetical protein GXO48_07255 [Chlorobi bacterium]|nr:hypothetical protein [Chlorobiota bacterium]